LTANGVVPASTRCVNRSLTLTKPTPSTDSTRSPRQRSDPSSSVHRLRRRRAAVAQRTTRVLRGTNHQRLRRGRHQEGQSHQAPRLRPAHLRRLPTPRPSSMRMTRDHANPVQSARAQFRPAGTTVSSKRPHFVRGSRRVNGQCRKVCAEPASRGSRGSRASRRIRRRRRVSGCAQRGAPSSTPHRPRRPFCRPARRSLPARAA
jgi:hypothetical protein